jgi:hypothetical protein
MRIRIVRSLQGRAVGASLDCHVGIADVADISNEDNQYCCKSGGEGLQSVNIILGIGKVWEHRRCRCYKTLYSFCPCDNYQHHREQYSGCDYEAESSDWRVDEVEDECRCGW